MSDLRETPLEEMVEDVSQMAAGGREFDPRPRAALDARLAIEVSKSLDNLTLGVHTENKHLVERADQLTRQLGKVEDALREASEASSRQQWALIICTAMLVIVTIALVVATVRLGG